MIDRLRCYKNTYYRMGTVWNEISMKPEGMESAEVDVRLSYPVEQVGFDAFKNSYDGEVYGISDLLKVKGGVMYQSKILVDGSVVEMYPVDYTYVL